MVDYLIVGAGFYGSICAYELNKQGYKLMYRTVNTSFYILN